MNVDIHPLPDWARATRFRPLAPPIFPGGNPSRAEIELALALFAELDAESQAWYSGEAFVARLRDRSGSSGQSNQTAIPE